MWEGWRQCPACAVCKGYRELVPWKQFKTQTDYCLSKTPKSASYSALVVRLLFIGGNLTASILWQQNQIKQAEENSTFQN